MPIVLEEQAWGRWLDPELTDVGALASLLEPRSPELVAYEVSPRVNDPRHDDPSCLEPAEPAQRALF
jgi:putative SOS response-associated peptidase YedK